MKLKAFITHHQPRHKTFEKLRRKQEKKQRQKKIRTREGILQVDAEGAPERRQAAKSANLRAAEEYETYFARGPGGHGRG